MGQAYAPFGTGLGKETFTGYPAYLKSLEDFKKMLKQENPKISPEEVMKKWHMVPGHFTFSEFKQFLAKKQKQNKRNPNARDKWKKKQTSKNKPYQRIKKHY